MDNLTNYISEIKEFNATAEYHLKMISTDFAHNMLIYGIILASKPEKVLEIGIGSGLGTRAILSALDYNNQGKLNCVDSFVDYVTLGHVTDDSVTPKIVKDLNKHKRVKIIQSTEEDFVASCKTNSYDLVVSDADHNHYQIWAEEIFRITKNNGFIFLHDVGDNDENAYINIAKSRNISWYRFNQTTIINEITNPDLERTFRGMLMIINKK